MGEGMVLSLLGLFDAPRPATPREEEALTETEKNEILYECTKVVVASTLAKSTPSAFPAKILEFARVISVNSSSDPLFAMIYKRARCVFILMHGYQKATPMEALEIAMERGDRNAIYSLLPLVLDLILTTESVKREQIVSLNAFLAIATTNKDPFLDPAASAIWKKLLCQAAEQGNIAFFRVLISIKAPDLAEWKMALTHAIRNEQTKMLKSLIIPKEKMRGETILSILNKAIMKAEKKGQRGVIDVLLDQMQLYIQSHTKKIPDLFTLCNLAKYGRVEGLKLSFDLARDLYEKGGAAPISDSTLETLLATAAKNGQYEVVKLLEHYEVRLESLYEEYVSALSEIFIHGDEDPSKLDQKLTVLYNLEKCGVSLFPGEEALTVSFRRHAQKVKALYHALAPHLQELVVKAIRMGKQIYIDCSIKDSASTEPALLSAT